MAINRWKRNLINRSKRDKDPFEQENTDMDEKDDFVEVEIDKEKKVFIYGYKHMVVPEGTTDLVSLNYDQARHLYAKGIKYKYSANEFGAEATRKMMMKLKNFLIDSSKDKSLVLTPFKTNIKIMITWLEQDTTTEDETMLSFLKITLAYSPENVYKYKRNI